MKKISVDEDKDSTRKFKSSEIVRYYVDGGIKAKDNKGAWAYVKQQKSKKPEVSARSNVKGVSSTDSEILAIKLAMKNALDENIDPSRVIIYTDQYPLTRPEMLKRSNSKLSKLRKELDNNGFTVRYYKSQHTIARDELKTAPPKVLNALAVHTIVNKKLEKPNNRYLNHLCKKRKNNK